MRDARVGVAGRGEQRAEAPAAVAKQHGRLGAGAKVIQHGGEVVLLPAPGVLFKQVWAGKGCGVACHPAVAEVEAVAREARGRQRAGEYGKQAVVVVAR